MLWLSSNNGRPLTYSGIEQIIGTTTFATTGIKVSPRLRSQLSDTALKWLTDNAVITNSAPTRLQSSAASAIGWSARLTIEG